jgi:hypothetical protein
LSLHHRKGGWVLSEIKAKCNEKVKPETLVAVGKWLGGKLEPAPEILADYDIDDDFL